MKTNEDRINERFVRRQGKLIEQSAHLNNLLTTIGTAIIGFVINLLYNNSSLTCCQKINFKWGLIFAFSSVIFGLLGAISRLFDYRSTLKKIKRENENAQQEELDFLKIIYKTFGNITWFCFYSQVILLLISVIVIGKFLLKLL